MGELHESIQASYTQLRYIGVDGIDLIPIRRLPGRDLLEHQAVFNKDHSAIRAAVERAVAHFKCWRMFSEEGRRFRAPSEKFAETLTTTIGLLNFARFHETYQSPPGRTFFVL
jgi:hypothetical protein